MTINSKKLYMELETAYQDVKQQLADAGIKTFMIHVFAHPSRSLEFSLQAGDYAAQEEAKGKDLQALVNEVIRRHNFRLQQNSLQLMPPPIDTTFKEAPPEPVVHAAPDDEIPF